MNYSNWYSIQVAVGCEKKVKADIMARKNTFGDTFIESIEVPETTQMVLSKSGQKKKVKKLILPGYVLLQIRKEEIEDEFGNTFRVFPSVSNDVIRSTFNVLGFSGPDKRRPYRLSPREVQRIFQMVDNTHDEVKTNLIANYVPGDIVDVIDGPFTGCKVEIKSVSPQKISAYIDICGQVTTAEFTKDQIYMTQTA